MMNVPEVGRQVIFRTGHPHHGERGVVIEWRDVMLFPELGLRPVVRLENGTLCMITDLDKDWRYAVDGPVLLARAP